jgi:hypothetical protein
MGCIMGSYNIVLTPYMTIIRLHKGPVKAYSQYKRRVRKWVNWMLKGKLDGSTHPIGLPKGVRVHGNHLDNFYFRAKKSKKFPKLKAIIHAFWAILEVSGPGVEKS